MSFVGSFHSATTGILMGALTRRSAPRPHVHTVVRHTTDTRNVERLIGALKAEREAHAATRSEVETLRARLAEAEDALAYIASL